MRSISNTRRETARVYIQSQLERNESEIRHESEESNKIRSENLIFLSLAFLCGFFRYL